MTAAAEDEQHALRAVLVRGGTSKALFFHREDVPPAGPERERLLKRLMGTPDPLQIDGLGGATLSTSKVAIVGRSERPDADIDYDFVQVEVIRDAVDIALNCGNISAAVGPFAIDEGLVAAVEPVTKVRIWNTNTNTLLVAMVPVRNGRARVDGTCTIPGVPGTGAEILMDYAASVGSRTGALLPTGHAIDTISMEAGGTIEVTLCDAANPCVFVSAEALGLRGDELPSEMAADATLMTQVAELRGKAGVALGFWPDWRATGLPAIPMLVIVAPPREHTLLDGRALSASDVDLCARLFFLDHCHPSLAGTGALCLAAAARVEGTVVQRVLAPAARRAEDVRLGHPSGVTPVKAVLDPHAAGIRFAALGLARTARRLMAGSVYVPRFY